MSYSEFKVPFERVTETKIESHVPLCDHTSFGIGGPADLFAVADSADVLGILLKTARREEIPILIIGGGTNLLVSDEGFRGLAIKLTFSRMQIDGETGEVRVGAGVKTATLVDTVVNQGLGGLAFAAGLPGTIGGALAGNAGCFGRCLSEPLKEATLVNAEGEQIQVKDKAWFDFQYRHSALSTTGHILTEAVFALPPAPIGTLKEETTRNIALRKEKHPPSGMRTAGSYFKNLPPLKPGERRRAAGLLLDQVGAKHLSVGDAAVFEKHANIIVNKGNATALEVLRLAEEMRRRVMERFNVLLEPEVRFVGKRPEGL